MGSGVAIILAGNLINGKNINPTLALCFSACIGPILVKPMSPGPWGYSVQFVLSGQDN